MSPYLKPFLKELSLCQHDEQSPRPLYSLVTAQHKKPGFGCAQLGDFDFLFVFFSALRGTLTAPVRETLSSRHSCRFAVTWHSGHSSYSPSLLSTKSNGLRETCFAVVPCFARKYAAWHLVSTRGVSRVSLRGTPSTCQAYLLRNSTKFENSVRDRPSLRPVTLALGTLGTSLRFPESLCSLTDARLLH